VYRSIFTFAGGGAEIGSLMNTLVVLIKTLVVVSQVSSQRYILSGFWGGLFTSPQRLLSCVVILYTGAPFKVHASI